eukprot:TRINITY_DN6865_c0_g1_i2.p2 TRINITY_DN6865_c0_g1~~TRINITY_DN6865_c0_g1_i2.p2  ORF type:complete len:102 (+),score=5.52 TRINITY_DN6865_c0_g1_i2:2054-2359(+)
MGEGDKLLYVCMRKRESPRLNDETAVQEREDHIENLCSSTTRLRPQKRKATFLHEGLRGSEDSDTHGRESSLTCLTLSPSPRLQILSIYNLYFISPEESPI